MSENMTRREHAGHQLGCFYSGSVDGDPSSAVSVSLCHGMVSQRLNFRKVSWIAHIDIPMLKLQNSKRQISKNFYFLKISYFLKKN